MMQAQTTLPLFGFVTEELVEAYGDMGSNFKGLSHIHLRAEIRDEVYARFSERMIQLGMQEFMVDLEERWRNHPRRAVKVFMPQY